MILTPSIVRCWLQESPMASWGLGGVLLLLVNEHTRLWLGEWQLVSGGSSGWGVIAPRFDQHKI